MGPVLTHRATSVVDAARLHRARDRRQRGRTLVEGPDLLADVVQSGAEVIEVFGGTGLPVDERALARLSGTKTPRGPIAVVEIPTEWLDRSRNLLVSVGVSDPGNVGTLIRTSAAFGWGYAYLEGSADPWSPKTIRAGAGGQFQTSVSRVGSLSELGEWTLVATTPTGGDASPEILDWPVAVLVGEESQGLPERVVESADHVVSIPIPGQTESLNVAVAAGIVVYELSKHSGASSGDV